MIYGFLWVSTYPSELVICSHPSFQGAHDVSQRSGWAVANAEAASAADTETSQIQETYQDET